jgi:hypothetical protein
VAALLEVDTWGGPWENPLAIVSRCAPHCRQEHAPSSSLHNPSSADEARPTEKQRTPAVGSPSPLWWCQADETRPPAPPSRASPGGGLAATAHAFIFERAEEQGRVPIPMCAAWQQQQHNCCLELLVTSRPAQAVEGLAPADSVLQCVERERERGRCASGGGRRRWGETGGREGGTRRDLREIKTQPMMSGSHLSGRMKKEAETILTLILGKDTFLSANFQTQ